MGDFINRRRGVEVRYESARRTGARIGTCLPVVGELFHGVEYSESRERNRDRLSRALASVTIWPFDLAAAIEFGRIAADLQRTGRPIGKADVQIAAIALSLGNTVVVSSDSDLAAVPGLAVENWAA